MYKIKYTHFNQTGGVNELKPYKAWKHLTDGLKGEILNINGANIKFENTNNPYTSTTKPVEQLRTLIENYETTVLVPLGKTLADAKHISTIKSSLGSTSGNTGLPPAPPSLSGFSTYDDRTIKELIDISKDPSGEGVNSKNKATYWIEAFLDINKQYVEALETDAVAAASYVPTPVAVPPSLTNKKDGNKLNDQQKEYVKAYMVALSEVSKLNRNPIMTPQLMDFFHKSGFEVNPMGNDLIKRRPSQTFAESDLSLLLTIGGYKKKSESVYSRF